MEELRKQLRSDYPALWFRDRFFGFECGAGWLQIIKELFDELVPLAKDSPEFCILQVKEKFGDLRVYAAGTTEEIDAAIDRAECKSNETCDRCGEKGIKRMDGWISVRCDLHAI